MCSRSGVVKNQNVLENSGFQPLAKTDLVNDSPSPKMVSPSHRKKTSSLDGECHQKEQIPRVHDSCDSFSKIITWATSHPFPALVFLLVVVDPSVSHFAGYSPDPIWSSGAVVPIESGLIDPKLPLELPVSSSNRRILAAQWDVVKRI